MAVYPMESDGYGHDTAWTTANRPDNPNHGTKGYNSDTQQLEVYDAVLGYWLTTVSMLNIDQYPA
jgi:hypothetical protein